MLEEDGLKLLNSSYDMKWNISYNDNVFSVLQK